MTKILSSADFIVEDCCLRWFDAKVESHHKGLEYLLRFLVNADEYIYGKRHLSAD